jgi:hypothetical protein
VNYKRREEKPRRSKATAARGVEPSLVAPEVYMKKALISKAGRWRKKLLFKSWRRMCQLNKVRSMLAS